jgi:hypothetical protein
VIQFCGVQVRPGDIIMGDRSGVVVIRPSALNDVIAKRRSFTGEKEAMLSEILAGASMTEVDEKYSYETMNQVNDSAGIMLKWGCIMSSTTVDRFRKLPLGNICDANGKGGNMDVASSRSTASAKWRAMPIR